MMTTAGFAIQGRSRNPFDCDVLVACQRDEFAQSIVARAFRDDNFARGPAATQCLDNRINAVEQLLLRAVAARFFSHSVPSAALIRRRHAKAEYLLNCNS